MTVWKVPYPKFGAGPGLARAAAIAAHLGLDLAAFGESGAVIVGSNGKGSTAAMCAALLGRAPGPVGLFTSPHLLRLNERFRIDGEDISDDELALHWAHVAAAIDVAGLGAEVGGFEFLFLIAADWFAARGCAYTVWEAGIGGRLDPVRLIEARRVALTALDFEHTDLLGDSLEAIACDKADAAPDGAVLYLGPIAEAPRRAVAAHCAARGVRVDNVAPLSHAPLLGAHQRANAALALALARDIAPLSEAQIAAGFAAVRWPGRLEIVESSPEIVIDVGHTPRGIEAALEGFEPLRAGRRAVLVCGVSADKDAAAIMALLAPGFQSIICAASRHKGARAAELAALAAVANPSAEIVIAEDAAEARRVARAKGPSGVVYVAGSLFLAAEFKALAAGGDPASLSFF